MAKRECPDTGTCHHECLTGCWRVTYASPLTIAGFPGNDWPEQIIADNAETDGVL